MLRIGTSGWQYRDWRGAFYPRALRQADRLVYYAQRFATVEVNNTFYELPRRETFAGCPSGSWPGSLMPRAVEAGGRSRRRTFLASDRMSRRNLVGSVDKGEFLVAVAASLGVLRSLGRAGLVWEAVVGLLLGGMIAAPPAAWLVRLVTSRLLEVSVGGLIILTNSKTWRWTPQFRPRRA